MMQVATLAVSPASAVAEDWDYRTADTKCLIQNSTHDYNALQFYA